MINPDNRANTGRGPDGRFLPGQTGNPGGRPPSVRNQILAQTADGTELIVFYLLTMRGEMEGMTSERSRMEALKWLSERVFGKTEPFTHGDMKELALEIAGEIGLSPEEALEELDQMLMVGRRRRCGVNDQDK